MPGLTYASEEYGAVKINWDKEAESYSQNGYEFQGYNVYQFYKDFKINTDPIKVAVFDKVDGVTRISGEKTEPTTGNRYVGLIQEGSDSGIKNRISINKDYTIGTSLKEGEEYYFGVSAYYYNKEKNKSVESGINKFKVTVNQEDDTKLPEKYTLSQNYPNPFNPNTKIKFTIPYAGDEFRRHGQYASPSFAAIRIYDVLGREVQTLFNGEINEGEHEVEFNASNLPSGIYFYTLQVNSKIIDSKKMVLLK